MSINTMTPQQLEAARVAYDDGINEGGEGFNPYTAELERRAEAALPPLSHSVSRQLRIDALTRKLAYYDANTTSDAELQAWRDQRDQLQAEADAEFLADWPLDVTRQRRREWAAWVRANTKAGKVATRDVAARIKRQGWSTDALKRAVALHGIQSEKV